jgi:AbrB family looped-hinge helix DNA binding protein
MPTLKLHYEGWVALPAGLCQQLGLKSGDRLGVDLVDGTIMLRPVAMAKRLVSRADPRLPIDPPCPGRTRNPDAYGGRTGPPQARPTAQARGRPRSGHP